MSTMNTDNVTDSTTSTACSMLHRLAGVFTALSLAFAPSAVQADVTYVHTDHLGNPVAYSNGRGELIAREFYTPYGERLMMPGGHDEPDFTGHVRDASTGLVYMQARYYDPEIGRFLSVDPVTFSADKPQQFNRYWYANGNPYLYTDPDGQFGLLKLAIKFAIKGGDAAATFGGMFEDANTIMDSNAPAGARIAAGVSLASEVVSPVSMRDAKAMAATGGKLYHYTKSDNVDGILQGGLKPGADGKVYLTPDGSLSPDQAQIDLALPPNGARDAVLEIDVDKAKAAGVEFSSPSTVQRDFNMPGGGTEVTTGSAIPPEAIKVQ